MRESAASRCSTPVHAQSSTDSRESWEDSRSADEIDVYTTKRIVSKDFDAT
jgi:hypothetical protein